MLHTVDTQVRTTRADYEAFSHLPAVGVLRTAARELVQKLDGRTVWMVNSTAQGGGVAERMGLPFIWRCHIGLDTHNASTKAAWDFLRPWLEPYDRTVLSLPDYVPDYVPDSLADEAEVIHPAIDPLSHKNRPLNTHKLTGVLVHAGLLTTTHLVVRPPFATLALRFAARRLVRGRGSGRGPRPALPPDRDARFAVGPAQGIRPPAQGLRASQREAVWAEERTERPPERTLERNTIGALS